MTGERTLNSRSEHGYFIASTAWGWSLADRPASPSPPLPAPCAAGAARAAPPRPTRGSPHRVRRPGVGSRSRLGTPPEPFRPTQQQTRNSRMSCTRTFFVRNAAAAALGAVSALTASAPGDSGPATSASAQRYRPIA